MAQQGSLYQDHGCWYVRYWETVRNADGTTVRRHPACRLASVKDYPKKSDVILLKNQFMDRLNKIGFNPGSGVSFVDFVENTFLPGCERRLSGAGIKCYRDTWNCHLKSRAVGHRLRDVRPVHIQLLLNAVEEQHGTNLAHATYKTMKVTLSAIFTEARNLGLYEGANPTTGVRIPKGRRHGRKRLAYSLDEILKHLELFSEDPIIVPRRLPRKWKSNQRRRKRIAGELSPNSENSHLPKISAATVRAILGVTAFAALRNGEILGLWWDDDRIDTLRSVAVSGTRRSKAPRPKRTSTIRGLCPSFGRLRLLLDAIKPKHAAGFVFVSRVGGAMDLDNLANRVLRPIFEANGMEWKGWHAYRRGLATNLKELGVEDTTIQSILRHENVSTTQRFYIKTAPKVAQQAMRILEEKIACTAVVQQTAVN